MHLAILYYTTLYVHMCALICMALPLWEIESKLSTAKAVILNTG
jgi:hypothetical protein